MAVSTTQRNVLFGSYQYNCVLVPYTQWILSIPDGCPGAMEGGGGGGGDWGGYFKNCALPWLQSSCMTFGYLKKWTTFLFAILRLSTVSRSHKTLWFLVSGSIQTLQFPPPLIVEIKFRVLIVVIVITGTKFFKVILRDLKLVYKPVESVWKW